MHLAELALVVLDRVKPLAAVLARELAAAPVHLCASGWAGTLADAQGKVGRRAGAG